MERRQSLFDEVTEIRSPVGNGRGDGQSSVTGSSARDSGCGGSGASSESGGNRSERVELESGVERSEVSSECASYGVAYRWIEADEPLAERNPSNPLGEEIRTLVEHSVCDYWRDWNTRSIGDLPQERALGDEALTAVRN